MVSHTPRPTRPRRHPRRATPSFILLEVIVASVIMGISLAIVATISSRLLVWQRDGESMQIAAMILDEQLELLVAVGPDDFPRIGRLRGTGPTPYESFRYEIDIDNEPEGDPSFVTATCTWTDAGVERSLTIETLVSPRLGDDPDPDRQPEQRMGRS